MFEVNLSFREVKLEGFKFDEAGCVSDSNGVLESLKVEH